MKRTVLLLTTLMLGSLSAFCAERPAYIRGVRPLAMGNSFIAVADDQNVFFYNPAGTVQRTGSMFTLLDLSVTVGKDLLDAYKFISDNKDKLAKFDEQTTSEQIRLINDIDTKITKLDPHVQVSLPNTNFLSGPIGKGRWHWGFGGFGQVEGSFRLNTGIIPNLDYDVNADAIALFNLAKRWESAGFLPGKLGTGLNFKYINRGQIKDSRVSFLQLENYDSPPFQMGKGFGADLGFLYQPGPKWNLGLTAMDLMGTDIKYDKVDAKKGFRAKEARTDTIKTRWNLGAAWTPSRIGLERFGFNTNSRLLLAADLTDINNRKSRVLIGNGFLPDTTWTHVHLGAEYRWWFFRFRGGFNQGYSTFGFGLDLPLIKLDYAYYSDEKGLFAGTIEQANHMVSLALRFGGSKTEARERVRASKAANKDSAVPATPEAKP